MLHSSGGWGPSIDFSRHPSRAKSSGPATGDHEGSTETRRPLALWHPSPTAWTPSCAISFSHFGQMPCRQKSTAVYKSDSKPPRQRRDGLASRPQRTNPRHQEEEITESGVFSPGQSPISRRRRARRGWPASVRRRSGGCIEPFAASQGSRGNTNGQPDMHGRPKRTREFLFHFCQSAF